MAKSKIYDHAINQFAEKITQKKIYEQSRIITIYILDKNYK